MTSKFADTDRRKLDKLLWSLASAAVLALSAWVYTTGNRVTALESRQPTMEDNIRGIRDDVREIRSWVVPRAK